MAASCFSPVNSAISFKNTFAGECKRRLTWFSWDSVAITGLFIPPKKKTTKCCHWQQRRENGCSRHESIYPPPRSLIHCLSNAHKLNNAVGLVFFFFFIKHTHLFLYGRPCGLINSRRIEEENCLEKMRNKVWHVFISGTSHWHSRIPKKKKKAGKVTSTRPPAIKAQFLLAPTALPHWPAILKYILCTTTYIQVCV